MHSLGLCVHQRRLFSGVARTAGDALADWPGISMTSSQYVCQQDAPARLTAVSRSCQQPSPINLRRLSMIQSTLAPVHLVLQGIVKAEHDVRQAPEAVRHQQLLDGRAHRPHVHLRARRIGQHHRPLRRRDRQRRKLRMLRQARGRSKEEWSSSQRMLPPLCC